MRGLTRRGLIAAASVAAMFAAGLTAVAVVGSGSPSPTAQLRVETAARCADPAQFEREIWCTVSDALDVAARDGLPAAVDGLVAIGDVDICHEVAHELGRWAFHTNGVASIAEWPTICNRGMIHGVLYEWANPTGTERIRSEMLTLCDPFTVAHEYADCMHGIGHAIMIARPTPDSWVTMINDCAVFPAPHDGACANGALLELAEEYAATADAAKASELLAGCAEIPRPGWRSICTWALVGVVHAAALGDTTLTVERCLPVADAYDCGVGLGQRLGMLYTPVDAIVEACNALTNRSAALGCAGEGAVNTGFNSHSIEKADAICDYVDVALRTGCRERLEPRRAEIIALS